MKVVRVLSLLVMFSAFASVVSAQDNAPSFGVLAGFNQSYFATTPKNDGKAKQGVLLGAFAVLRKDKSWKIQPEAQFSQRRAEVALGNSEATYSTSYLNLSLLVRTKLYKRLYTANGPQFSIPVRASLKTSGGTLDVKENTKSDFSIVAGLGYQHSSRIAFEARYDAGMKTVEELPLGNFVKRNRAITVMAAIGF